MIPLYGAIYPNDKNGEKKALDSLVSIFVKNLKIELGESIAGQPLVKDRSENEKLIVVQVCFRNKDGDLMIRMCSAIASLHFDRDDIPKLCFWRIDGDVG